MFDIKFYKNIDPLKQRVVKGEFTKIDADKIIEKFNQIRSTHPIIFNIETTNICNMKCVMCPRTDLMTRPNLTLANDLFLKAINEVTPHTESELETFWKFVEDQYEFEFSKPCENTFYFYIVAKCLTLHGYGEPLLDKYIYERITEASNKNIPTYFSCVPANLTLERAEELFEAGLTVLKVSIDALDDETQKDIRGEQNNFDESYQTILDILKLKKLKNYKTLIVPTMIDFSIDEDSKKRHDDFLDLWEGRDVFAYVKSQDNRWLYEEDKDLINSSHYEKQYCEFPWTSLSVSAEGSIVPCTQDYNTEMSLGNLKENTLEEIWNSDNYKKLREWHIKGNFPAGHKCIERCDQKKLFEYLN